MAHSKKEQLINQIQLKQEELTKVGLSKGVSHEDTILISTELDMYIYELQKMELADK
ncbi:aspartyl-phosphate phosphatase Spo0E family protein [Paraliobacillus zengyii]|uniref:aspartyl-phosphate phosphatase Spo0E family protein n=1 Tax=Paraliobacillus zengyii TaxID=2213194 RepID=UPI0013009556|nr:aspartyl-phosphate phosphatase Spo0E family protein [Paraliobacillus zengyii]